MALFTNSADNSEPAPRKVLKIAILGAGSWGTAFAKIVADSARENKTGVQVVLIGRSEQAMAECSQTRENSKYFPGMKLPENLEFTADAPTGLTGADLVVLALPSQVLRSQLQLYARYIEPHALLVSLAKGFARFVDCGAYIGDTLQALCRRQDVEAAAVFEPDAENFARMSRVFDEELRAHIGSAVLFPCGAAGRTAMQSFAPAGGSGTLTSEGSVFVQTVALDQALKGFAPTSRARSLMRSMAHAIRSRRMRRISLSAFTTSLTISIGFLCCFIIGIRATDSICARTVRAVWKRYSMPRRDVNLLCRR